MRITVVHNPDAGDQKVTRDSLLSAFRRHGYAVQYRSTKDKGFLDSLHLHTDVVAVAGGDGSIRKVACRLMGTGIPIAVIPVGTANNIAKALTISEFDPDSELKIALDRTRAVDMGTATGPWGDRHFVETAGWGLFCNVLRKAERQSSAESLPPAEALHRDLRVLQDMLSKQSSEAFELQLDGRDISGEFLLIEAMNIPLFGPNVALAPQADFEDGLLDVVLLDEPHRGELDRYLSKRLQGLPPHGDPPRLPVRRARTIQIKWRGSDAHFDDQLWPEEPEHRADRKVQQIVVQVHAGAVEFLV